MKQWNLDKLNLRLEESSKEYHKEFMPLIVQDNRHVHKQGNRVKCTQLLK